MWESWCKLYLEYCVAPKGNQTSNQTCCLSVSKLTLAVVVFWTPLVGRRPKPSLQLPQLALGSLLQFLPVFGLVMQADSLSWSILTREIWVPTSVSISSSWLPRYTGGIYFVCSPQLHTSLLLLTTSLLTAFIAPDKITRKKEWDNHIHKMVGTVESPGITRNKRKGCARKMRVQAWGGGDKVVWRIEGNILSQCKNSWMKEAPTYLGKMLWIAGDPLCCLLLSEQCSKWCILRTHCFLEQCCFLWAFDKN